MKVYVPDYYQEFHCIAGACKHTCCKGWEIDVDQDSLDRYQSFPDIMKHISMEETPHFILKDEETCPFLREDCLCQMYLDHGEDFLCQICTDHPRFRNFWNDRIEMGIGLACEEAARIILTRTKAMRLVVLEDDGIEEELPEDEEWLMDVRQNLYDQISGGGPEARLMEYLIYRHIADALYDDRLEERIEFVQNSFDQIMECWQETDGTIDALIECARAFSNECEYME
ncbi:MAG: flagellin lysine-N-methylase [Dorea sp.]|nr:flagellin lysine-N-methylase [Dorea sp.]